MGWGPSADLHLSTNIVGNKNKKRADNNYLADERGPHHLGHVVVWIIHLNHYSYSRRLPPLPFTRHDSLQPWKEEFSDVENGLRMRRKFGKN